MMTREDFIEAIAPMFKQAGFKKTRSTWHKDYPETIAVFNVQASQWGADFYLNAGVYLKALGHECTPPEHHCHLRLRLDMAGKSVATIHREALAWLEKNSTPSGMRQTIIAEPHIPATLDLKKQLGIA